MTTSDLPSARSVERNPSQERLRELARSKTPRVTLTEFGNLNYRAEVTARLKNSTFFVTDVENHQNRISRAEADKWAALQDEYIASRGMLLIEGYIGPDPGFRTGSRLYIEDTQANIAGMQAHLYFPPDQDWEPEFTVIYTPGLPAWDKPDDRLIMVDNDRYAAAEPGPGIDAIKWLIERKIMLVGADNWGVEAVPGTHPDRPFEGHQWLIQRNGIYLLENLDLESLATDRVYEFAFIFSPVPIKGATGSPGNPIAVR